MGGSLAAEILKLRKRPATWIIAVSWLLLALGFGYVLPYLIYLLVSNTPEAQGGGAPQRRRSSPARSRRA